MLAIFISATSGQSDTTTVGRGPRRGTAGRNGWVGRQQLDDALRRIGVGPGVSGGAGNPSERRNLTEFLQILNNRRPAPATAAPVTGAPVTPEPVTGAPVTGAPVDNGNAGTQLTAETLAEIRQELEVFFQDVS